MKLIVDLIYEGGLERMRYSISDTAEFGDYTRGPRVIDEHVREEMEAILGEIRSGTFAREWIAEMDVGEHEPEVECARSAASADRDGRRASCAACMHARRPAEAHGVG